MVFMDTSSSEVDCLWLLKRESNDKKRWRLKYLKSKKIEEHDAEVFIVFIVKIEMKSCVWTGVKTWGSFVSCVLFLVVVDDVVVFIYTWWGRSSLSLVVVYNNNLLFKLKCLAEVRKLGVFRDRESHGRGRMRTQLISTHNRQLRRW